MAKRRPKQTKVKLGDKARDRITGFTGIVTGYAKHLTGCDTVGLKPQELKDGKTIDSNWFDISQIEVLERSVIKLNQDIEFEDEQVEPPPAKKRVRDTGGPTSETPGKRG
jgi:hypothetical protein